MTYTSSPLLDGDELLSERKIFIRVLRLEEEVVMECKKERRSPSARYS